MDRDLHVALLGLQIGGEKAPASAKPDKRSLRNVTPDFSLEKAAEPTDLLGPADLNGDDRDKQHRCGPAAAVLCVTRVHRIPLEYTGVQLRKIIGPPTAADSRALISGQVRQ